MATPPDTPAATALTEPTRLTRDDWLRAAHAAVVEGGFDAVRVLGLAQSLGVTRGSFYWHFPDHAALLQALVQRWVDQEAALGARLRETLGGDARADLLQVLDVALSHSGDNLENMRFELALRGMGRRNSMVAQELQKVDALRSALFEELFGRLCSDPRRARELATLFYLAIVGGIQALSRPNNPPQTKEFLRGVIAAYVIDAK